MQLQLQKEINAPADKVWDILAHQFADIATWATSLDYSRPVQLSDLPANVSVHPEAPIAARATPNPLGELIEVLIDYSEEHKQFTFLALGLPPIIRNATNTTHVKATSTDSCVVTFDVNMEFKGFFRLLDSVLRRRILTSNGGPNSALRDLKVYAEAS